MWQMFASLILAVEWGCPRDPLIRDVSLQANAILTFASNCLFRDLRRLPLRQAQVACASVVPGMSCICDVMNDGEDGFIFADLCSHTVSLMCEKALSTVPKAHTLP